MVHRADAHTAIKQHSLAATLPLFDRRKAVPVTFEVHGHIRTQLQDFFFMNQVHRCSCKTLSGVNVCSCRTVFGEMHNSHLSALGRGTPAAGLVWPANARGYFLLHAHISPVLPCTGGGVLHPA